MGRVKGPVPQFDVVRIRRTEDLDAVADIDRIAFPDDVRLTTDELVSGEWWLATDGDRLLGFIGSGEYQTGELHLVRYGVSPEIQSKGLGRRLVRCFLRYARSRGIERITTYVLAYNLSSLRCLIRCGFVPYAVPGDWTIWVERRLG